MVNAGFIYQQVDLYLQSQGFGACWIGMGKAKSSRKDLKSVILIAFGNLIKVFTEIKKILNVNH